MSLARFPVRPRLFALAITVGLLFSLALPLAACAHARAGSRRFYQQTHLVSDLSTVGAKFVDPHLKNAWGVVAPPNRPFWIADNATGVSTLYLGDGTPQSLVVTIPAPGGGPAAPTGIVFNSTDSFKVSNGKASAPALFIFATEDGTISGWNPTVNATQAILTVKNSASAIYKGLALGSSNAGSFLYAANFHDSRIDVFDKQFHQVHLSGSFRDPTLPAGYAPFGIRNIESGLYVTYALQGADKKDDVAGLGHGFVDVFDLNGHLLRRFASRGTLDSPWGLALAPDDFGPFSQAVLVGNFGDGRINAFDSHSGKFLGQLKDQSGNPITIDGIWGLTFGEGARGSDSHTLYFTAGPNDEMDGLFGTITARQT